MKISQFRFCASGISFQAGKILVQSEEVLFLPLPFYGQEKKEEGKEVEEAQEVIAALSMGVTRLP